MISFQNQSLHYPFYATTAQEISISRSGRCLLDNVKTHDVAIVGYTIQCYSLQHKTISTYKGIIGIIIHVDTQAIRSHSAVK